MHKTGGRLPDRCVRCNGAVGKWHKKTLYWHPPAVYLGLLLGALPYIILSLVTRKSTTVEFGLCEEHNQRRLIGMILLWAGLLGGMGVIFLSASQNEPLIALLGLGMMLAGPIVGSILGLRTVMVKKIDDHYTRFKVGQPFLESLPQANTMRTY